MVTVLPPDVIWLMPLYGVYLLMSKKSGVFGIGMIKKIIHFNCESPSFCNMIIDTDISLTYLSIFSINQQTVLLY